MSRNAMQWDGSPGHYEVWYVTLTDPGSGVGVWIRLTLLAPLTGAATCSLWLLAMDPVGRNVVARKATYGVDRVQAQAAPFRLAVADARLEDGATAGRFEDVGWDLRWTPGRGYDHVGPLLRRAKLAKTVLTLPHGDVPVRGWVRLPGGRELRLDGARGGQAHLHGTKHAARWAWAHAGDLVDADGRPAPETFLDGVSVCVPRLGRELGPASPVVGRFLDDDFACTSPLRVFCARSRFGLLGWELEATAGRRRLRAEVTAERDLLAGVTYHDPDGARAYCYNSEVASIRIAVLDRVRRPRPGWRLRQTLVSDRRAHFEFAQRQPVPGVRLLI